MMQGCDRIFNAPAGSRGVAGTREPSWPEGAPIMVLNRRRASGSASPGSASADCPVSDEEYSVAFDERSQEVGFEVTRIVLDGLSCDHEVGGIGKLPDASSTRVSNREPVTELPELRDALPQTAPS